MKRLIYQVYTGKRSKLYDHCTASVKAYAERINKEENVRNKVDYIVQTQPIMRIKPDVFVSNRSTESYEKYGGFLPIYEKENAFDYWDRYDQICATPEPIRTELLTKYHKWKYLSYHFNLMNNGKFDLRHYIKNYYEIYREKINIDTNARIGYKYFDIAELLYQCKPDAFEQHLNIKLDRKEISNYTDNNFKQLNKRGLRLDDQHFLDNLTDVIEQQMLQTIDLNEYINENSDDPDIQSRFKST